MVLHNSDGSVAEISGNGIRCLAQAVLRSQHRRRSLRSRPPPACAELDATPTEDPLTLLVTVDMGAVDGRRRDPRPVVEWGGRDVASLSIGNPHLVLHLDDADSLRPAVDGAAIESLVPGGINVELPQPEGPDVIRLTLVYERGVGVTEACGSGRRSRGGRQPWGWSATVWGGCRAAATVDIVHQPGRPVAEVIVP